MQLWSDMCDELRSAFVDIGRLQMPQTVQGSASFVSSTIVIRIPISCTSVLNWTMITMESKYTKEKSPSYLSISYSPAYHMPMPMPLNASYSIGEIWTAQEDGGFGLRKISYSLFLFVLSLESVDSLRVLHDCFIRSSIVYESE
jgi:hypothetical protein